MGKLTVKLNPIIFHFQNFTLNFYILMGEQVYNESYQKNVKFN